MSETKFLSGPMEICPENGLIISKSGEIFCDYMPSGGLKHEANAHLIAAAPEMYSAIENLLVELDAKRGISLESMIGVGLRRCLEDAYHSLAKARGEV